jgi:predicted MFS family arabinose efflux permease
MLSSISYNGSRAVGPLIGGVLLAAFGSLTAVLTYAATCVAVMAATYVWRSQPTPRTDRIDVLGNVAAGLRYARGNPALWRPLAAAGFYFACVSPLWAFVPLIAKSHSAGSSSVFSLFMMAIGTGAVGGGLSRHLNGALGFFVSLRNGAILTAAAFVVIALSPGVAPALVGFLLAGMGWIGVSAGINSHILLETADQYRSRMIAIVMIVFSGSLSLGSILWGQVARQIGIPACFLIATALLAILAVSVLLRRSAPRGSPAEQS